MEIRLAISVAFAYLWTGVLYVWRDFRQPIFNRPAYIGHPKKMLFVVFFWLPATIFATYQRGVTSERVQSWVIFAVCVAIGVYFYLANR